MRKAFLMTGVALAVAATTGCAASLRAQTSAARVEVFESADSTDARLEALTRGTPPESFWPSVVEVLKAYAGLPAGPPVKTGVPPIARSPYPEQR